MGAKKGYKAGGMAKCDMPKKSSKGGKTNMDMKMMGRNMAKMKAQGK